MLDTFQRYDKISPFPERIPEASECMKPNPPTVIKTARLAWDATDHDPALRDLRDPILLLIERTSAKLRADGRLLAPLAPVAAVAAFVDAHGAMIDLVTPWIARVSPQARAELRARIEEGTAPSPFCRRGGGSH